MSQQKLKGDAPPATGQNANDTALIEMETLVKERSLANLAKMGSIARALILSETVNKLRTYIRAQLPMILPLMGTRLGFLTDKDKPRKGQQYEPYHNDIVVDCCCEALLRGLYLTGNEFNIIAGGCMTVKNGYARLLKELPSVSDLDLHIGIPQAKGGGVIIACEAQWRIDGTPVHIKREYPLKQDAWTTLDALMGKAERRLYRDIYNRSTGSQTWTDPDDEGSGLVEVPADQVGSRTSQVAGQLSARSGNGVAPTPAKRALLLRQLNELCAHCAYTEEELTQEVTLLGAASPDKLSDEQLERLIAKIMEANNLSPEGVGTNPAESGATA